METLDLENLPPDRVTYLKELVESWKDGAQQDNLSDAQTANGVQSLSPQDRELIAEIRKLRDEIGPVDFNVTDALRELRERN